MQYQFLLWSNYKNIHGFLLAASSWWILDIPFVVLWTFLNFCEKYFKFCEKSLTKMYSNTLKQKRVVITNTEGPESGLRRLINRYVLCTVCHFFLSTTPFWIAGCFAVETVLPIRTFYILYHKSFIFLHMAKPALDFLITVAEDFTIIQLMVIN